jgi:hypothetical protein
MRAALLLPGKSVERCRHYWVCQVCGLIGFSETKKPGRLGYGQPGRQVQQSEKVSLFRLHILREVIPRWNRRSREAVVEADDLTIIAAIQWIEFMSRMDQQGLGAAVSPGRMPPLPRVGGRRLSKYLCPNVGPRRSASIH